MLEFFLCVGLIYALLKIDSLTEDIKNLNQRMCCLNKQNNSLSDNCNCKNQNLTK